MDDKFTINDKGVELEQNKSPVGNGSPIGNGFSRGNGSLSASALPASPSLSDEETDFFSKNTLSVSHDPSYLGDSDIESSSSESEEDVASSVRRPNLSRQNKKTHGRNVTVKSPTIGLGQKRKKLHLVDSKMSLYRVNDTTQGLLLSYTQLFGLINLMVEREVAKVMLFLGKKGDEAPNDEKANGKNPTIIKFIFLVLWEKSKLFHRLWGNAGHVVDAVLRFVPMLAITGVLLMPCVVLHTFDLLLCKLAPSRDKQVGEKGGIRFYLSLCVSVGIRFLRAFIGFGLLLIKSLFGLAEFLFLFTVPFPFKFCHNDKHYNRSVWALLFHSKNPKSRGKKTRHKYKSTSLMKRKRLTMSKKVKQAKKSKKPKWYLTPMFKLGFSILMLVIFLAVLFAPLAVLGQASIFAVGFHWLVASTSLAAAIAVFSLASMLVIYAAPRIAVMLAYDVLPYSLVSNPNHKKQYKAQEKEKGFFRYFYSGKDCHSMGALSNRIEKIDTVLSRGKFESQYTELLAIYKRHEARQQEKNIEIKVSSPKK